MVNMHKDEGGVRTKTYLQTHLKGDKSPRMPFFNTGTRDTERHRRKAEPPLGPGSVFHRRKGWPDRWQEVIGQDMFIFSENRQPI